MRTSLIIFCFVPMLVWGQQEQAGKPSPLASLAWQKGPTEGRVADKATIKVPPEFVFLDSKNTSKFLEIAGNPPRDGNYTFAPKELNWFSIFSFNPSGYVKDDEKIDPDELLKTLKASDGPGNEERKRLGMSSLTTEGWEVPPHYDIETKRLEWAVRLKDEKGQFLVNYATRILGRNGVMSVVLVSDPQNLQADVNSFKTYVKGFDYLPGERYAEFKQGDKVAEYGLAALVVGGAAAAAAKTGLLGALWKYIVAFVVGFWKLLAIPVIALFGWIGSRLKRRD